MKKITIGIIAHVDSGKTTLSEALLYLTGTIRSFGRVDKGASFLDHNEMERRRGITIYSKQARFYYGDTEFTLIDTPGHADFSAEMERVLKVLDYAVLLISAADGIRGQTETIWRLLSEYRVPVFVFFNKMDQDGADREQLLRLFRSSLSPDGIDFGEKDRDVFYDQAAMCSEEAMDRYLETGEVPMELLVEMIARRKLFPCFFGSALKMEGVRELLEVLDCYTMPGQYPDEFGARVIKILRDPDGSRLTMMKITGGILKNKAVLPDGTEGSKINQIRIYNGTRFTLRDEAAAGEICCVTGLKESYAGQGYGTESDSPAPLVIPILNYRVILSQGQDPMKVLPQFRVLEEENPELTVSWEEEKQEIHVCVMGEVQLEILTSMLAERFGITASFDSGEVMYKETITAPVIGSGHFEPLRHYAEVHFLMEPLERGSGLVFESRVRSDSLSVNWQRLILTHLSEKQHKGVLTGSPITDMKISLVAGKAHLKHTEGGDFRQAVYRAVRQGLMMADNLLLEPYYRFVLELPSSGVGRAMTDLERFGAQFGVPETKANGAVSVIRGRGPVSVLKDYPAEIAAYTKGQGSVAFFNDGYDVCHDQEEVILRKGYDPLADVRNTPDSVFCSHGAGYIVPYDEAYEHMHVLNGLSAGEEEALQNVSRAAERSGSKTAETERRIGTEEIEEILSHISRNKDKDKKPGTNWKRRFGTKESTVPAGEPVPRVSSRIFSPEEAEYTVVDGYNVIFAWPELADLARINIDSARDALIDLLTHYKGMISGEVIAVFDAYRVKGRQSERTRYQNIQLVYTAEEETADQYIEKFTNEYGKKSRIAVVTSDHLEQIITRGQGCMLISSRDFRQHLERLQEEMRRKYFSDK
ncbi:MAG: NYN domain-containing protein [Parasporobacterium sp.]|nr:NYN domain-containing protein [Parasporobacterium sp.]